MLGHAAPQEKILPKQWEQSLRKAFQLAEDQELSPQTIQHAKKMYTLYVSIKAVIAAEITDSQNSAEKLIENVKQKSEKEFIEWQRLQALINWIEEDNDPFNLQKINLLTIYATDSLLTMDARLKQTRMIWLTGFLYIIGIAIIVACPLSTAVVKYAYGTGWGMVTMLVGILLSKLEGIWAATATMEAASEGVCRQSFKDADAVQSNLEKERNSLEFLQKLTLDLKQCGDAARMTMASTQVKAPTLFADLADEVLDYDLNTLRARVGNQDNLDTIPADFSGLINEMKKLQKSTVPEDQAVWVELLKCLTPLTQNPFNLEALDTLQKKSAEASLAADTREKQDETKKLAKIALYLSLAITVTCIAIIAVAMLGYSLAATSSIVLTADTFILVSKLMFWLFGAGGTAAGVIDTNKWRQRLKRCCSCKEYCSCVGDGESENLPKQKDKNVLAEVAQKKSSSRQSPLQKISLFSEKIYRAVQEKGLQNVERPVLLVQQY